MRSLRPKFALGLLLTLLPFRAAAQPADQSGKPQPPPRPPSVYGVVLSSVRDMAITIVDRDGKQTTLNLSGTTAYLVNKQESTFDQVVRVGMTVKCYLSTDDRGQTVAAGVSARGMATDLAMGQVRAFMGVSDEEWNVLLPRIERVRTLQRIVEGRGNGPPLSKPAPAENNPDQQPTPEMISRTLVRSLQLSFWETEGGSASQLRANLQSLRDARAKARAELATARKELRDLLTVKQEVLLVLQGILD